MEIWKGSTMVKERVIAGLHRGFGDLIWDQHASYAV